MNVWNRFTNTVLEFFLIFRIRNTIHRMQDDLLQEENRLLTADNETLDRYVDDLLQRVDRDIRTYNNDQGRIQLPDIRENLPTKLWMKGEIRAWNGWFEDISTIRRNGVCRLKKRVTDKWFALELSLTLDNLTLGYDDYQIKLGSLKRRGKVTIKVLQNSLLLRISLPPPSANNKTSAVIESSSTKKVKKKKTCQKAILKEVVVTKLEDIRIDVTGCGKIGNKLAKTAIQWTIKENMENIKEQIRIAVTDSVRSTIERTLCDGC